MYSNNLNFNNKYIKNNQEYNIRKNKLIEIKKNSKLFITNFSINNNINKLCNKYRDKNFKYFENIKYKIKISGRIVSRRILGKITFITLQDINNYIQLYININNVTENIYKDQNKLLDIGDIIGVEGNIFKTKTNELSLNCKKIFLLVKCLYPLAEKFHGLINEKIKSKKRYLDLISNNKSRETFILRSKIITSIRNFLIKKEFIEVETPILQSIPGGADANPFITKYINFNKNFYLRIAPELYLKRLMIGGFNRIFEIGKNFRNEGISANHNPEFTTIELYVSYVNFNYLIKLIQDMLKFICKKIFNKTIINYKNENLNFNNKFNLISMKNSIYFFNKIENLNLDNIDDCIFFSRKKNIIIDSNWSIDKIQSEIFKKTVEKKIIQPTFITEYPIEISPLSKRNDKNVLIADRFELFISGLEIGNGFSELNDPEDQYKRFTNQLKYSDNKFLDKDYITAMEYGLPPSAGVGIGIDRLIMIFTNNINIRDVILFPLTRYK